MLITKSQVKYIQSLGHKKFRDTEGVFVVEGPKITGELLRAPNIRLRAAYGLREWIAALPKDGLPAFDKRGAGSLVGERRTVDEGATGSLGGAHGIMEVTTAELQRLSALTTPNQVVAVFEKPVFPDPLWTTGLFLVLDGLQDPGNLGTIVRLADWFGVDGVLCSPDSADVFNPKAVQSTMGSISRVPVWYGAVEPVLRSAAGMPVWAALLQGESLYGQTRIRRGFIVIGNESKGISPSLQELATHRITIPRIGEAESLNAAVAAGIILSHIVDIGSGTPPGAEGRQRSGGGRH
jgi:RNA methyltransferase, TrmH family